MASKPLTIPLWCTTGAKVSPPSMIVEDGATPGQSLPAQYINWLLNLSGNWAQYLSDGELEGDHSIDGDLTLTGELKHGAETLQMTGLDWVGESSYTYGTDARCVNGSSGNYNQVSIKLKEGDRLTNVNVFANQTGGGTLTLELVTVDDTGTVSAPIASDTATGSGINSLSLTGLTSVLGNGTTYFLRLRSSGGGVVVSGNTYITFDRP